MTMKIAAAIAGACVALPAASLAQSGPWPQQPVKVIVPYGPGGPTDVIARIISDKLAGTWKQSTVIESRPGAGSNTGSAAAARSAPDGYTLLVNTSAVAVNQTLFQKPGYDALKDLIPIINVAQAPNLIIGTNSLKATTLKDALEEAKSGKLSFGSPGTGTTPHLTAEYLFKVLAKVDVAHVPFKGGNDVANAALQGSIQFASGAVPTLFAVVSNGGTRGLGVTSKTRVAALPNVPTVAEAGFKDFEDYTWIGFFAPTGTPREIVAKLNADMNTALAAPDVRERLTKIGFEVVGGDQAGFAAYVEREIKKWATVVKAIGIPPM